jgi:hypothetical protein
MPAVITTGGTFICANAGTVSPTAATATFKIDANDVLIATDIVGLTVSNCTNPTVPCTTVMSFTLGASTILKKGAVFVLLTGATFATNGTAPLLTALDTQTKLISI